jgi:hypothetical protein
VRMQLLAAKTPQEFFRALCDAEES